MIDVQQDTSCPDPAQLRTFAREPMPFHDVEPRDLELIEGDTIRHGVEHVEYRWTPEYVKVETDADDWTTAEETEYDIPHREAWEKAEHTTVEEDYITALFVPNVVDLWQAEAVWILDSITITREG